MFTRDAALLLGEKIARLHRSGLDRTITTRGARSISNRTDSRDRSCKRSVAGARIGDQDRDREGKSEMKMPSISDVRSQSADQLMNSDRGIAGYRNPPIVNRQLISNLQSEI